MLPFETMTNPGHKLSKHHLHDAEVKSTLGDNTETITEAANVKKWNQGHYITKFTNMHPVIQRGISMFLEKRIMIDQNLMEIISKNFDLLTSSDFLSKLHNNHWGQKNFRASWMGQPGTQFLTVETGMMQGILHYTSSLFHCLKILFMKDYIIKQMKTNSRRTGNSEELIEDRRIVITPAVSSDDSSFKISFEFLNSRDAVRANITLLICLKFGSFFGEILGIYDSVKTTRMFAMVGELYSEFTFHKNTIRPLLRWITACNLISEQEFFASWQEEMSSNLTTFLSGGGSFSLTCMCQIAQAILHYALMGPSISLLFVQLMDEVMKVPDPGNGFFYMDHPFFAGLCGF